MRFRAFVAAVLAALALAEARPASAASPWGSRRSWRPRSPGAPDAGATADGGARKAADAGRAADAGAPDAGHAPDAGPDSGPRDAGAARAPDAGPPPDPCAAEAGALEKRLTWLRARRAEQGAFGGPPNPALGVPNAMALWCEAHATDEECRVPVPLTVTSDELTWRPDMTPEDFDSHVILMKRALKACRERQANPFAR